jgi:hypothetical protein
LECFAEGRVNGKRDTDTIDGLVPDIFNL